MEKSYLIFLPALRDREKRRQPGRSSQLQPLNVPSPRRLCGSCLSSPRPRRSARPPLRPSAAALPLPPPGSSPWAGGPSCTWRSRARAAAYRPARSGASRSAAGSAAAAAASRRPRRPTWRRTPVWRWGWTGRGSRWGSRCRRRRCPSCRTWRSPTSGRVPSGMPSASSSSTCGHSAFSSAWLPVGSRWLHITKERQTSEKLLHSRNPKHRSSQKSQNHQVLMCLKVTQLR